MSELNKYIIHETSASRGDVSITAPFVESKILQGFCAPEHREELYHWAAKKAVAKGARYQFVSQSDMPPGDVCLYDFDYSNADGFGSSSCYDSIIGDTAVVGYEYTQSFRDYISESKGL